MPDTAGIVSLPMAARIRRLPDYLFARVNALKAAARAKGVDVIDFGMGNPDRPPVAPIIEKLVEVAHDPKGHRYSASRGLPHLRKEIAKRYKDRYDVDLDPDRETIVTIGSKEGLTHLMWALLDEGDTVMVPSPTYPIHTFGVLIAGGRPVTVPMGDTATLFSRIAAAWEQTTPRPKILILSFPHNPTATTVEPGFFEPFVPWARERNVLVIHDIAYADVLFGGYEAPSFLQTPGAKDVGVEFFSLTKSYNMAGWRVGFMLGNSATVGALQKIKSYLDYGIFTPIQVAAITALREGREPSREISETYRRRMEILCDGLQKLGWGVTMPRATMYLWAKLPEAFRQLGSIAFAEKMIEEAAVAVAPGAGFGPEGEGFARFALVENEERVRQALRNLKRLTP